MSTVTRNPIQTGVDHLRAGRWQQAESVYQDVLRENPRSVDAMHLLGITKLRSGRPRVAVDLIRQAVTLRPEAPELHNSLGTALRAAGQVDAAESSYLEALRLQPTYLEACTNLAQSCHLRGRAGDAIRWYQRALRIREADTRPRRVVAPAFPPDFDEPTVAMIRQVAPYTMTSRERLFALRQSVCHVVEHDVPGDLVECGVWKGGSMMAAALTLQACGDTDRGLYLFDTFEGMPEPTDVDCDFQGRPAAELVSGDDAADDERCGLDIEAVREAMHGTGYDAERITLVPGRVEQTLPDAAPQSIALLRLDTNWYESTRHELVTLYPRLSVGGVLIVDDYGHWQGARRAVDDYIEEHGLRLLLHRVDYTGRVAVKTE